MNYTVEKIQKGFLVKEDEKVLKLGIKTIDEIIEILPLEVIEKIESETSIELLDDYLEGNILSFEGELREKKEKEIVLEMAGVKYISTKGNCETCSCGRCRQRELEKTFCIMLIGNKCWDVLEVLK